MSGESRPGEVAQEAAGAAQWHFLRPVPLRVAVAVPVPGLKVRDLQNLRSGALLTTATAAADDVCVRVGGAMLAMGELDNVDGQMAVRLTRLA